MLVAHRVAVFLTTSIALCATRYPVPGAIDSLGVQPYFWGIKPNLWQTVGMRLAVSSFIPDVCFPRAQAVRPFAGDFRDQDLRVLVHELSPVRRRSPSQMVAIWFRLGYYESPALGRIKGQLNEKSKTCSCGENSVRAKKGSSRRSR